MRWIWEQHFFSLYAADDFRQQDEKVACEKPWWSGGHLCYSETQGCHQWSQRGTELELGMREIGSWQRDVCVCITSINLYKYADMILAITHESFRNRRKPYMHEHELKRIRNTEVYIFKYLRIEKRMSVCHASVWPYDCEKPLLGCKVRG